MTHRNLITAYSMISFPWMRKERNLFLFFLLWSLWLGAEYWLFGPLSYVRIHDTANTHLPVVMSLTASWRQLWSTPLMGWLCSIDRLSNYGWWSNFYLPFMILPPWLAHGVLMTIQRLISSYFTFRLMRDCFGGSILVSLAAGCVFSLLHTDLGEVSFMHGLNEPGVPLLLWFFWRLPLNPAWRAMGWSALLGVVAGWGMSFIIGTAFTVPVVWLALQAGREDCFRLRPRLILTGAMGIFFLFSVLPRLPELWALVLAAPESYRGLYMGMGKTNWPAFLNRWIHYCLAWWPFGIGVLVWLAHAHWRRASDRVVAVFLLMGVVAAPLMDPLRNWLSPWLGVLRGVDFKRFQIVAPLAFSLALACALSRCPEWIGRLTDKQGRLRLQLSLSGILAALILATAIVHSAGVKQAHGQLQRNAGYNWRALFGNADLLKYAKQARTEGVRFATAGAHQTLHPGYMLAYGVEIVDGHSQLYGIRYYRFWSEVIRPLLERDGEVRGFHKWGQYVYLHHARSGEDYLAREIPFGNWYNLNLLSLAGVGYIVADKPIADDRLGLMPMPIYEQRLAIWDTLPMIEKIRLYGKGQNPGRKLFLYRNDHAQPRHFLVPNIQTYADYDSLWKSLGAAPLEDLLAAVYVVQGEAPESVAFESDFDGEPVLEVVAQRPEERRLRVYTPQPCILVVTDQYYPWWHWKVNGKEVRAFPAYGVFQGIVLEVGESVIEGQYQPTYKAILNAWPMAGRTLAD